jgi:SAM-dependent methyltransferase
MNHTPDYFDDMFSRDSDPWRFKTRWYEQRKRAVTLACLPGQRYASGYEPGCANGELSASLAERCDALVVSDGSTKAVALARERLAGSPHVDVREAWLPAQWPAETFDLIVVSELGYFLKGDDLADLARRALASLRPGGTILACHWRWGSADCEFDGDEVHRRLKEVFYLPNMVHLEDRDFVLDVWSDQAQSIAQAEGLL